jgi:hypothetical protein
MQFPEQAHDLLPPEAFLHEFPLPLTDRVARMPGGAGVDRTAALLPIPVRVRRDMRGEAQRPSPRGEPPYMMVWVVSGSLAALRVP